MNTIIVVEGPLPLLVIAIMAIKRTIYNGSVDTIFTIIVATVDTHQLYNQ
jgi:hypothetical protein